MKFLLLGVVSLAQFQRRQQGRQQQRPVYGREDGQYGQQTHQRQVDPFRQGRFGGHTDINRRDQRYTNPTTKQHYNAHAGRYGGYTRHLNQQTGHFQGRQDPFRRNTQGTGNGLNIYRHGTDDRMGNLCSRITAATYQRECTSYTGRNGCRDTCARLRAEQTQEQGGQRRTQNRNPFGQHRTQQRQQRTNPFAQHRTQQRQQRTNPFGQHRTQTRHFGQRGQTQQRGQHHYEIPTQGGLFGRHSRTQTHTGYGQQTHTRQRGIGQNGIFGNRLGQEGHNRQQHHL